MAVAAVADAMRTCAAGTAERSMDSLAPLTRQPLKAGSDPSRAVKTDSICSIRRALW
ncbi:hypothetical protein [Delftia sp. WSY_7]|uniref:hypothetical protein n=1 Tax=Delftia sp. WSY_7 TaxID=3367202 RepID=UPI00370CB497